jgi:kynurenine 3-monooxygenase
VDLYERGPDPRKQAQSPGRSTHLIVSARGWRAIAEAGAEEAVRKISIPLAGRTIHTSEGKLTFQPYGAPGQAIHAVDRAALNLTLTTLAVEHANVRASFDRRCLDVDLDRTALELEDTATYERTEVVAERVFAADGAFSRIRFALMRKGRFDYSQSYIPYAHKELGMQGAAGRLEPNSTHVWPRHKLMMIAFPNPGGAFTATLVMQVTGENSFASIGTRAELRAFFERNFPDAISMMPEIDEQFFAHPILSPVTTRCFPWFHGDKVILMGDAAHAMVPFLGQGMNCSFEDCLELDRLMTQHGEDWPTIFQRYQDARKPNADAVTEMSIQHFTELAERVDSPTFHLKKALENKIHRLHPDRFLPLYPMIAFTHTPYSKAREIAQAQESVLDELMRHPKIAERWDSSEVEGLIHTLVERLPSRLFET